MRAINEDDVKRLIRSEKRNWGLTQFPGVTEALNHVEGGLVGIRTVESPMPCWISVEERLPEDDVNVLIYAVSNDNGVDSRIAMTSYTHRMHGFNIEGWRPPWQYFFFDYMITHWMPLPEPPKEE